MLYQPSNITPSSFAGIGGGTVSAASPVEISWQINGNSPMVAFAVRLYENNAASTSVYNTSKMITEGCPAYGTDNRGNPIFFTWSPDLSWGDLGIADGGSYKLKIFSFYRDSVWRHTVNTALSSGSYYFLIDGAYVSFTLSFTAPLGKKLLYNPKNRTLLYVNGDYFLTISSSVSSSKPSGTALDVSLVSDLTYVAQYSDSAFIARTAPSISLVDFQTVVGGIQTAFSASYSQAQGDSIDRVRWQLSVEQSGSFSVLEDTGWVNTGVLSYDVTGLLNGNRYAVSCTVVTESGVEATTGDLIFKVSYEESETKGAIDVGCSEDGSALVRWNPATIIDGVPTPSSDYGVFSDGSLFLAEGASVTWDTVDGKPMGFSSPFTVGWRGGLSELLSFIENSRLDGLSPAILPSWPLIPFNTNYFCFDPCGRFLVARASNKTSGLIRAHVFLIWGDSVYYLMELPVPYDRCLSVSFSSDGKYLFCQGLESATSSDDYYLHTYLVSGLSFDYISTYANSVGSPFYPSTGKDFLIGPIAAVKSGILEISDGVVSKTDFEVKLRNYACDYVSVSRDGNYIAAIYRYDYDSDELNVYRVDRNTAGKISGVSVIFNRIADTNERFESISFSADGSMLILGNSVGIAYVYTLSDGIISLQYSFQHPGDDYVSYDLRRCSAQFVSNSLLAFGKHRNGVALYSISKTEARFGRWITEPNPSDNPTPLCADPRGDLLLFDGEIWRIRDAVTTSLVGSLASFTAVPNSPVDITENHDGTLAVISGYFSGYAAAFSVENGEYTFLGNLTKGETPLDGPARCACFSEDGTRLVLGGYFGGFASAFSASGTSLQYLADVTRSGEPLDGVVLCCDTTGDLMVLGGFFESFASCFRMVDGAVSYLSDLPSLSASPMAVSLSDGFAIAGGNMQGTAVVYSILDGQFTLVGLLSSVSDIADGTVYSLSYIPALSRFLVVGSFGVCTVDPFEGNPFSVSVIDQTNRYSDGCVSPSGDTFLLAGQQSLLFSVFNGEFASVASIAFDSSVSTAFLGNDHLVIGFGEDTLSFDSYSIADRNTTILSVNGESVHIGMGTVSLLGRSVFIPIDADTIVVSISDSVGAVFFLLGDQLLSSASFSSSVSFLSLSSITIYGAQRCDWVYAESGSVDFASMSFQPVRNAETLLFANFEDGNLQAGTYSTGEVRNSVYRIAKGESRGNKLLDLPTAYNSLRDFGACSLTTYQYELFFISNNGENQYYSTPILSSDICCRFSSYYLYEAVEDQQFENVYHVQRVWRFGNNIEASAISNNNHPTFLQNFTPYRLHQPSAQHGKSGTLSALLSNAKGGVYSDTAQMMEELFAASRSLNTFFLKDMKGNLYMVAISAPITQTIYTKSALQPVTVSISWEEIGDASGIALIQTPEDPAWRED